MVATHAVAAQTALFITTLPWSILMLPRCHSKAPRSALSPRRARRARNRGRRIGRGAEAEAGLFLLRGVLRRTPPAPPCEARTPPTRAPRTADVAVTLRALRI